MACDAAELRYKRVSVCESRGGYEYCVVVPRVVWWCCSVPVVPLQWTRVRALGQDRTTAHSTAQPTQATLDHCKWTSDRGPTAHLMKDPPPLLEVFRPCFLVTDCLPAAARRRGCGPAWSLGRVRVVPPPDRPISCRPSSAAEAEVPPTPDANAGGSGASSGHLCTFAAP